VSAAPPNSIESEADCGDVSDAHLSQSATDLDTQIELPGDGMEVAESHEMGVPTLDGMVEGGNQSGARLAEVSRPIVPENVTSPPRKVILADFNRLMVEIEASNLVQEELIIMEPQLASTASFLSIVSGGTLSKFGAGEVSSGMTEVAVDATAPKETIHMMIDKTAVAGVAIFTGAATVAGAATAVGVTSVEEIVLGTAEVSVADVRPDAGVTDIAMKEKALWETRYKERMKATRITAAKSLLRDELKKVHPSNASIAAFRKAAYGEENSRETSSGQGGGRPGVSERSVETSAKATDDSTMVGKEPDKLLPKDGKDAVVGTDEGTASGGISSDEDEMSIDESDDGGEISDDYSISGHSTSGGESIVSRESRKRRADESPEREGTGSVRKGFPGVVSRSEAGCRIHIPLAAGVVASSGATTETAADARTDAPESTTAMDIEEQIATPVAIAETDT